jgi:hypothetical protein
MIKFRGQISLSSVGQHFTFSEGDKSKQGKEDGVDESMKSLFAENNENASPIRKA